MKVWYGLFKKWVGLFIVILAIATLPRNLQSMDGYDPYALPVDHWDDNFFQALRTPFTLFSSQNRDNLNYALQHLPLTLFFILFALTGALVFGTLKGLADVFWRGKAYQSLRGVAWVGDAVPLFGLVILTEMGTLYGSMNFKGDLIHMLPDKSVLGGVLLPAVMLLWGPMMYVSRLVGITVHEQLAEQYVLTARSKGLQSRYILMRHILKNCVPKLLNEFDTVYMMVVSGLIVLEWLSFRTNGALFSTIVAMGHAAMGQGALYTSPGIYNVSLITMYLLFLALLTLVVRLVSFFLRKRWAVTHHA